jgi:hypothetical protein
MAGSSYILAGEYYIPDMLTLTIQAGTTIVATPYAQDETSPAIIVMRGGKLRADGTATNPITFTALIPSQESGAEVVTDTTSPNGQVPLGLAGKWGGIMLLGRAPAWGATPTVEGFTGDSLPYSGTDPSDSSGLLRYVRVWHAGAVVGPNNEINGITFAGVGAGTTVEHCEVAFSLDDGFEWFGGTVNVKWLASLFINDDAFDMDNGYQGRAQFLFAIVGKSGDRGFEIDGQPRTGQHRGFEIDGQPRADQSGQVIQLGPGDPRTAPQIRSVTVLGGGTAGRQSPLVMLRDGTAGTFAQALLTGSMTGIFVAGCGGSSSSSANSSSISANSSSSSCANSSSSSCNCSNCNCSNCSWVTLTQTPQPEADTRSVTAPMLFLDERIVFGPSVARPSLTSEPSCLPAGGLRFRQAELGLGFINMSCLDWNCPSPDYMPRAGGEACQFSWAPNANESSFFVGTECYGAFASPDDNWLAGWTWLESRGEGVTWPPPPPPPPPPRGLAGGSGVMATPLVAAVTAIATAISVAAFLAMLGLYLRRQNKSRADHQGNEMPCAPSTHSAESSGASNVVAPSESMFDSLASMIKYRDFKQIKVLGSGVHGRAVLLQSPDGTELAVSKDAFVGGIGREELRRMEREVRILSMLNHPYIIAYRCCFQRDDLLCIVTEYAGGGNLKELIRQHRFGNEPFSSGQVIIWLLMTASDCH